MVLNPDQPGRDGMTYFGAGYQAGACGVTIDRITTAHNGQFKCSLFDTDRSNEGFINVVVAGRNMGLPEKQKGEELL